MKRIILAFTFFASTAYAGLDVTAYSGLVNVESPSLASDKSPQDKNQITLSPVGFPERFVGLESGKTYRFRESFDFRAGSYSGCNM